MGSNGVTTMGDPSDVTNVSPYTANMYNALQGWAGKAGQSMQGLGAEQNIASLAGAAPQIQGLVGSLTGPYVQNAEAARDLIQQQAMEGVASMYSGQGALQSGPALSAMAQGAAIPAAQTAQQIAQMQGQMGMGLGQQMLGQLGTQYQTQAGLLGSALGMQAGLAQPEWWQPTYVQEEGGMGILGGAGMGAGIGAAFGPWGAGIGAALGGLGGALGL